MKLCVSKKNTKLGKVLNVSLPPILTCPLGAPCATEGLCYALKAWRMHPSVREAWRANLELWWADAAKFERDLCGVLAKTRTVRLFRWHVAGDLVSYDYLKMMVRVAEKNPEFRFRAFTKQHSIVAMLDRRLPTNLGITISAWPGMPIVNPHNFPVAWMNDGRDDRIPADALKCPGKCDVCEICWGLDKDVVFNVH